MRIIKNYGQSRVVRTTENTLTRVLITQGSKAEQADIVEFAKQNDKLVIAQWISMIDAIFRKPAGKEKPTREQREAREKLGRACWRLMVSKKRLLGLHRGGTQADYLEKLWYFKVSPYEDGEWRPRNERSPKPCFEGRWYKRFLGEQPSSKINFPSLAEDIDRHLYDAETPIKGGWDESEKRSIPDRRQGRITARAASISGNVPELKGDTYKGGRGLGWKDADESTYAQGINVAAEILAAVKECEQFQALRGDERRAYLKARKEPPLFPLQASAVILRTKYKELFPSSDGALKITDAEKENSALFTLHMAVKDCYTRLFKRRKSGPSQKHQQGRLLSETLPGSYEKLFELVTQKGNNRDLNQLVRLGKIIHYEASGSGNDHIANVVCFWPDADQIRNSAYWTSDGQARIKRNEALVRVWRHVLALANRTLAGWADPKNKIGQSNSGDILGSASVIRQALEQFTDEHHAEKMLILLGNRSRLFNRMNDTGFNRDVLEFTLWAAQSLRHTLFHFKGLGGFVDALQGLGNIQVGGADGSDETIRRGRNARIGAALKSLWQEDKQESVQRLLKTMEASDFGFFFDELQNRTLLQELSRQEDHNLPLPRFGRMIQRAQDTWGNILSLPERPNRQDMERFPARRCQYLALKLLYEGPFREWFEERDTAVLQTLIDKAVQRATDAARNLNGKGREADREIIVSRADHLRKLAPDDNLWDFFFRLSSETASEMRVQRGYASDAEAARKQAEYIEDLKCEVTALAFDFYIRQEKFVFVTRLKQDQLRSGLQYDLSKLPCPQAQTDCEKWQAALYFLLHLVPVEEVGKLLHQLRKWEILAAPEKGGRDEEPRHEVAGIREVLTLYLAMHDAKFDGGEALTIPKDAGRILFSNPVDFNRVFPESLQKGINSAEDALKRHPLRGLREMMRFGDWHVLKAIFEKRQISTDEVNRYLAAERKGADGAAAIAIHQEAREKLHEEWVRAKKLSAAQLRAYVEVLAEVVKHRHLTARVTLTDHLRLHRVLMLVLGRLADYSGLWERDLYFATLALLHNAGSIPQDVFTPDIAKANGKSDGGLYNLKTGQIIRTLEKGIDSQSKYDLLKGLKVYFGKDFLGKQSDSSKNIRNCLAHFNMLRPKSLTHNP